MSLKNDAMNHLPAHSRNNVLPFRPASLLVATCYSKNELGRTNGNIEVSGADIGQKLSSAGASITPISVLLSSETSALDVKIVMWLVGAYYRFSAGLRCRSVLIRERQREEAMAKRSLQR